MESLQNILGDKDFTAPDEIGKIKRYIKQRYQSDSQVKIDKDAVIITVPSPALTSTLRLEQRALIEQCGLSDKKITIRIG